MHLIEHAVTNRAIHAQKLKLTALLMYLDVVLPKQRDLKNVVTQDSL
jgi:hypothetical protein